MQHTILITMCGARALTALRKSYTHRRSEARFGIASVLTVES